VFVSSQDLIDQWREVVISLTLERVTHQRRLTSTFKLTSAHEWALVETSDVTPLVIDLESAQLIQVI
jgi:hypothetical protein